jgi:hypothetical protein
MIYEEAMKIYQSTDMYTQLATRVIADADFNAYFDKPKNKIENLVPEGQKNLSYYKNLIKLYPESDINLTDGTKFSKSFKYFNDDMSLNASAPEDFKKNF